MADKSREAASSKDDLQRFSDIIKAGLNHVKVVRLASSASTKEEKMLTARSVIGLFHQFVVLMETNDSTLQEFIAAASSVVEVDGQPYRSAHEASYALALDTLLHASEACGGATSGQVKDTRLEGKDFPFDRLFPPFWGELNDDEIEAKIAGEHWPAIKKAFPEVNYQELDAKVARLVVEIEREVAIAIVAVRRRETAMRPEDSAPEQPPYLGINANNNEASRKWKGKDFGTVDFGRKALAWRLFLILVEARDHGIHRQDIENALGCAIDHPKSDLLTIIRPLGLNIKTGKWMLVHMD